MLKGFIDWIRDEMRDNWIAATLMIFTYVIIILGLADMIFSSIF